MHSRYTKAIKIGLVLLAAAIVLPVNGFCNGRYLDTLKTKIDAMGLAAADTVATAQDSAKNTSTLQSPIFSGGRDSIVKDFNVDGRKMIYYYGDVKVTYGDIEISSEYMAFDIDSKRSALSDTSRSLVGYLQGPCA